MPNVRGRGWLLVLVAGLLVGPALPVSATSFTGGPITINDASDCAADFGAAGPASPYPSTIAVSGLGASISDVNVTLSGYSHTYPDDVAALLVGPQGQSTLLMADDGSDFPVAGVDLTFDDAAPGPLPDEAQITAGSYQPGPGSGGCFPGEFPAPAPAAPYGATLGGFNGTDPNGTWSLYLTDNNFQDTGSLAGWSLDITAPAATPFAVSGTSFSARRNVRFTGTVATFTGPGGPADYTAAVVWGDGAHNRGTIGQTGPGQFTVTDSHLYKNTGTYSVVVRIKQLSTAITKKARSRATVRP